MTACIPSNCTCLLFCSYCLASDDFPPLNTIEFHWLKLLNRILVLHFLVSAQTFFLAMSQILLFLPDHLQTERFLFIYVLCSLSPSYCLCSILNVLRLCKYFKKHLLVTSYNLCGGMCVHTHTF